MADGERNEAAARYPPGLNAAANIKGYIAFGHGVKVKPRASGMTAPAPLDRGPNSEHVFDFALDAVVRPLRAAGTLPSAAGEDAHEPAE